VKLIEPALAEDFGPLEDDLRELWNPVIAAELKRLAAGEGRAAFTARTLLEEASPKPVKP